MSRFGKTTKVLQGKVSMIVRREEPEFKIPGFKLELTDETSGIQYLEIEMSSHEFVAALGSLAYRPCKVTLRGLENVGKMHEHQTFEFEVCDEDARPRPEREDLQALAIASCPEGWTPDLSFNSQNSTFFKDGKMYARTTIRRYVDPQV